MRKITDKYHSSIKKKLIAPICRQWSFRNILKETSKQTTKKVSIKQNIRKKTSICIVMAYYNRQFQLNKTLLSFNNYNNKLFEVIIVDDGSMEEIQIPPGLNYQIMIIKNQKKSWADNSIAINIGINHALKKNPNIIMLQCPECYHVGNVLGYALSVTDDTYISFGCFSLSKENTISGKLLLNNSGASFDFQDAWYNHPLYRPVGYDFCSAITTKNLIKLNGFDERFSLGSSYGDNYLLARIKMLKLEVRITETPFVVHQWHPRNLPENIHELTQRNSDLYNRLLRENTYRAKHLITPDFKND